MTGRRSFTCHTPPPTCLLPYPNPPSPPYHTLATHSQHEANVIDALHRWQEVMRSSTQPI